VACFLLLPCLASADEEGEDEDEEEESEEEEAPKVRFTV
jgi:hypothetical protein